MRIITNLWRLATAGALAAALSVPAFADDEEFPEGPKTEGEEALPGSEEEEMEEEEVDVLGTLEAIIGKMKDAESSLAQAGSWKATDAQGNAIEDADKLLTAKDLQDKAIREMTKIFDGSKDGQSKAVEGIEKLIKAAKEQQGQGQQQQQQKKKQQQKQPNQQQQNKSSNPAQRPYNPNGEGDTGARERAAELTDRWGNLPDRLRDEISQADDEFRSTKGAYREKLMEYSRLLGASE
ncbi:MAG: hypothetical protein IT452_09170 [Planctomycetia bacterium]|nr:hypothetical protein [Planctomycetia bacterium]